MRIATWNLQGKSGDSAKRLGQTLAEANGADIVLLQEVSPDGFEGFRKAAGLDWGIHVGLEFPEMLRAVNRADGPRSVAIAGRGAKPKTFTPFPDAPLPEKILATLIEHEGIPITVVAYHAPTGGHGLKKPEQAVQAAQWLKSISPGAAILGGDFNTPEHDRVEDSEVRTHWHTGGPNMGDATGDDVLVGPEPIHRLTDAYRSWLRSNPSARNEIPASGPLATTHVLSRSKTRVRYDQIWLSPQFKVKTVEHLYEEAIAAGTDHALVIVETAFAS